MRAGADNVGPLPDMIRHQNLQRLAEAQGVERPFGILLRMPEASRLLIGRLLGCTLRCGESPEQQAWRIINQNLRGLQARTHRLTEQLSPFARNNNWWEIVTRTARRWGLRFYPGLKDEEVERLLFEHQAAEFVRRELPRGEDAGQSLAELHPLLSRAIASLGLSDDGTRALVAALLRGAAAAPADAHDGASRLTAWLKATTPWLWTTSISTGLQRLQQRLGDVYEAWLAQRSPACASVNYGKVGLALAAIHLHGLVERTCEQFDLAGN